MMDSDDHTGGAMRVTDPAVRAPWTPDAIGKLVRELPPGSSVRFYPDGSFTIVRGEDRASGIEAQIGDMIERAIVGPIMQREQFRGLPAPAVYVSNGPCTDPDKMHGACDGFGGTDDPDSHGHYGGLVRALP